MAMRTFSPAPILERYDRVPYGDRTVWCEVHGFTTHAVSKWRHTPRRVSWMTAEQFAAAEGRHVCELWPEWFEEAV